MTHPEIRAEQEHFDRAHRRLDEMRRAAAALANEVVALGKGGTFAARVERDLMVDISKRRAADLTLGTDSLIFGRIDRTEGDHYHVGRTAVHDEELEPLVVDWRAPIAESFYRATPRRPMGLVRRRHFRTRGRTIVDIDDELLDADAETQGLVLMGEGALLAALERSRTGRMRDIVETIQAEQDEIIRAPLPGVLVVQGGPGTGKTAVALHRAAYLLYTHRNKLERTGVLVVGPNALFLRYIDQVLPSLGEQQVQLAMASSLVSAVRIRGRDTAEAARIKGDARMAAVVARAVRDRQRGLDRDGYVRYGPHTLTVPAGATRRIVGTVRRMRGTHNARRGRVETLLVRELYAAYRDAEEASGGARSSVLEHSRETRRHEERLFEDAIAETEGFRRVMDQLWPRLDPRTLIADLLTDAQRLARASRDVLGDDERRAILRPRPATVTDTAWTAGDAALVDEAAAVLGPIARPPRRGGEDDAQRRWFAERVVDDMPDLDPLMRADLLERLMNAAGDDDDDGDDEGPRTYGHVIVDEAQDLSPMQWRLLARRCPSGSMTIVGDLGQSSTPWGGVSWDDVLSHLPARFERRTAELTVNYRTPSEIMEVAAAVLAVAAPGLEPPQSVRESGVRPTVVRAEEGDLAAVAARTAKETADAVEEGRVAIVCPRSLLQAVRDAVGLADLTDETAVLDEEIAVLGAEEVKGLEFDGVVVVEPGDIAGDGPSGLRTLYVSLTRATKRLAVVHSRALPAPLANALARHG